MTDDRERFAFRLGMALGAIAAISFCFALYSVM